MAPERERGDEQQQQENRPGRQSVDSDELQQVHGRWCRAGGWWPSIAAGVSSCDTGEKTEAHRGQH